MLIRTILLLSWVATLPACSDDVSEMERLSIEPADGLVDLSEVLPGKWGRVCVIAPYSTNAHVEVIPGVPVNIEGTNSIDMLESIALLVTMYGEVVAGLFEVPGGALDFTSLGSECYQREDSRFSIHEERHSQGRHV